jgi:hypothetical protein
MILASFDIPALALQIVGWECRRIARSAGIVHNGAFALQLSLSGRPTL